VTADSHGQSWRKVKEATTPSPERFVCSPERPWKEGDGRALHPNVRTLFTEEGSTRDGGDYDRMECPDCGVGWWRNIPQ